MPDTSGDVRPTVTDPAHPIFAGIALTDGTMDNLYAEGAVPLPTDGVTISRGISINNNNLDDEGTVLATIAEVSADTGPVGGIVIAEFPAGATMENSGGSPTDVLGGPRLIFLTGSREPDGVTGGEAAALYDLYQMANRCSLMRSSICSRKRGNTPSVRWIRARNFTASEPLSDRRNDFRICTSSGPILIDSV